MIRLAFSIIDTGIGIPPEKTEAIFERFTQVDASTSRRYGGTGLGLAISKGLVEQMGGRIRVESELDRGTAFHFELVFKREPARDIMFPSPFADLEGARILAADDNAAVRTILEEQLASLGAEVTVAQDAKRAVAELARAREAGDPYGIVLLEVVLPDGNGFDIARYVKDLSAPPLAVVMMIPPDRRSRDAAQCAELEIPFHIVKPVNRTKLEKVFREIFSPRRSSSPPARERETEEISTDTRPLRILLAEDTEENRVIVRTFLKKTPYRLVTVENGKAALERFRDGGYDLVLMDMQMPVMDGYEATCAIRYWEREQGMRPTPIVALTAYAFQEDRQKSLDAGCDVHLTKPINKGKLLRTIAELACWERRVGRAEGARGGKERIRVKPPEDMEELAPWYLGKLEETLRDLFKALDEDDFDRIKVLGHGMKGSGMTYGFPFASEKGRAIEQAAGMRAREEIRGIIEELSDYLDRVEIVRE